MSSRTAGDTSGNAGSRSIPWTSILIAGAVAIIASMVANLIVRWIAVSLMDIPEEFDPLASITPVIIASIGYGVLAVIAFIITYRFASNLRRTWPIVALVGLAVSMIPALGTSSQDGANTAAVTTLVTMHIVAAIIIVPVLLRVREERSL